MPTFKFTAPDGKQYSVAGPEGATEQQAFQMLQSQMGTPADAAPAPAKPFGAQLNDAIQDVPRQIGLTARAGLRAVDGAANLIGTPVRAGLNAILPKRNGGITGQITGAKQEDAIGPVNLTGIAERFGLPRPRPGLESIVNDGATMVAGGALPIAAGAILAKNATGVTQGVGKMLAANPVQQLTSAGAAGTAGGYTRETGGDDTSQFAASLAAGIATPFAMNKLASAASRVATRAPVADPVQIEIQINNALHPNGMTLSQLAPDVQAGIRQDVAKALQVSGSLSPAAVRRLADYRLVGAAPTQAGLTLDPAIVSQQKNLAKLGINSKDPVAQQLGQTQNANNNKLIEGMNSLGASAPDNPRAGGQRIMAALDQRNQLAKSLINDRYAAARATDGRSANLDPSAFTNQANNLLDDALLGGKLPSDVRNLLNRAATGQMPLTVDVAEQFKTRIGDLQRATNDMAERKALGMVRQSLDDTPLLDGQGQQAIDAFNKARKLNRAWMGIVDKTPALQAVRDGIEPDKFVQQFIVGGGAKSNVADVEALKRSIKSSPDAIAAVKEQIASHLKAKALSGAADEVGNVSQSAYNKALNAIGDQKLSLFFTKPEVDQLKAIGRVASYEQVQPSGAAVNNSNTAGAVGNILERFAGSSLLSKVPFGNALAQPAQNIVVGMKSAKALDVPNALAGALVPPMPRARNGLMLSPAVLTGAEDDKKR